MITEPLNIKNKIIQPPINSDEKKEKELLMLDKAIVDSETAGVELKFVI